jgi:hypothetical protein
MRSGVLSVPFAMLLVGAGGFGYFADEIDVWAVAAHAISQVSPSCNIKGNISINSGEHIYHLPGHEHYDETIIRTDYGERWFCSEAEARAAGWRKAKS